MNLNRSIGRIWSMLLTITRWGRSLYEMTCEEGGGVTIRVATRNIK